MEIKKMEKLACIFPGQGVQYPGMGKSIFEKYEVIKSTYGEASEAAGFDVADLCFNGPLMMQNDITRMQIINVITGVAFYRAFFEEYRVLPQFFAGHSMGEYAAYVCCGAIRLKDAVKILLERGRLLQKAIDVQRGYMAVVENLRSDEIRKCIAEKKFKKVVIACYNDVLQHTVSGDTEELDQLCDILRTIGGSVTPLLNSPPIHTPVLGQDIVYEFRDFLKNFKFSTYSVPVISNVYGVPNCDPSKLNNILYEQLYCPVQWTETINQFEKYGVTTVIEMGPKLLLNKFTHKDELNSLCLGVINDNRILADLFASEESLKRDKINFVGKCLVTAVSMKNWNEDNAEYQELVVNSYNEIKKYTNRDLTINDYERVADLLLRLLLGKKVDKSCIPSCFERLINETGTYYILQNWYESKMQNL